MGNAAAKAIRKIDEEMKIFLAPIGFIPLQMSHYKHIGLDGKF
jgi:hypothetical protein